MAKDKNIEDVFKDYVSFHNFVPGDKCIVTCKGRKNILGWGLDWSSRFMNPFVGTESTLVAIDPPTVSLLLERGGRKYLFPWYVVVPSEQFLSTRGHSILIVGGDDKFELSDKQVKRIKEDILGVD